MTNIYKIVGTLKVKRVFTCNKCQKTSIGSKQRYQEINANTTEQLVNQVSSFENNTDFPMGWSSYYGKHRNIYICDDCKEGGN